MTFFLSADDVQYVYGEVNIQFNLLERGIEAEYQATEKLNYHPDKHYLGFKTCPSQKKQSGKLPWILAIVPRNKVDTLVSKKRKSIGVKLAKRNIYFFPDWRRQLRLIKINFYILLFLTILSIAIIITFQYQKRKKEIDSLYKEITILEREKQSLVDAKTILVQENREYQAIFDKNIELLHQLSNLTLIIPKNVELLRTHYQNNQWTFMGQATEWESLHSLLREMQPQTWSAQANLTKNVEFEIQESVKNDK